MAYPGKSIPNVETLTGNKTLNIYDSNEQALDPNGASRDVTFAFLSNGRKVNFYNTADAAGENLVIKSPGGSTITTINRGEAASVVGDTDSWEVTEPPEAYQTIVDLVMTGSVDQDLALTAAGDAWNSATTINHATAAVEGIDLTIAQLTTARTSGTVSGIKVALTSLAGDTGGTYNDLELNCTDGGGATPTHNAIKIGAGFDALIDVSAASTGEADVVVGANLAAAFVFRTSALTHLTYRTTTATPGFDEAWAHTATATGHLIAETMNSASGVGIGLSVTAAQITTVRTSGTMTGIKSAVTSLTGDTAGVDYYAFEAAVTVGEANADHFAFKVGAGFDQTIDASACATTEAGWLVGANLADAWHLKTAALTYLTLVSTTATPGITAAFAHTGAATGLALTETMNSASAAGVAFSASASQITTARTSGTMTGIRGSVTSLLGDTAGVDYYAFEATVTAGEATADHFAFKQGAGFDWSIDSSSAATTEAGWLVASNVASALRVGNGSLTYLALATTTATPGLTETFAHTATATAHLITETMASASGTAIGLSVTASQITTARTSSTMTAIKASVTSLTGDTGGVDYYAFEGAVTVGGATADHFLLKQGAGFDWTLDASAAATTEAGILVASNVANAFQFGNGSLTYSVLRTSTTTPGIDETFTLTATGDAHNIAAVVNSATGVVQALDCSITTVTTVHSAGMLSAIRAATTSLAGDTGGTFACVELVSTDGGGTTPTHAGLACASPLDALLWVDATGSGSVVVGAMTAKNPETDTEAGYFSIRVGATRYEVPMYAIA